MLVLYKPQVRCTVTILLSDGKLSVRSGINDVPDGRWKEIKDMPEIVAKIKSGDLVPQEGKDAIIPKIDANTAPPKTLEQLPGVGKAIADRIVSARPHADLFSVKTVSGLTDDQWAKIEGLIEV